uniref:Glycoprotein n=1 Tax=Perhabdovirus anguilla TaxID=1300113 RepID=A0A0A1EDN7_9RHAB|nr:glycoprotein [Perhabdovirus anguilla]
MDTLIKILLIIVILKSLHAHIEFVPHDLSKWRDISIEHLDCPIYGDLSNQATRTTSVKYSSVQWGLKNNIDGYLCISAKWSVTCDYRWYGSKYISTSIEYVPTKESECRDAIKSSKNGELVNPHFMPENCGWNNVLTESVTYTTVSSHEVKLDPYQMTFVDSLFPGGKCSSSVCSTIYHQGVWINPSNNLGFCKDPVDHQGQLYMAGLVGAHGEIVKEVWNLRSVFKPEIGRSKHLTGSCWMTYCDQRGLRFSDGEWAGFQIPEISALKQVLLGLPECKDDVLVHAHDTNTELREILEHMDESALNAICQQEVRRAKERGVVSDWLLSMMTPFTEGLGPVYRLNKGKLEASMGYYRKVYIDSSNAPQAFGQTEDKESVGWSDLVPKDADGAISSMYNGNVVINNQIKWAKNALGSHILDEISALEFETPVVHHPHLTILSVNHSDLVSSTHPNGQGVNLIESVSHWAGGLWASIGSGLMILVLVALVGFCTIKVCLAYVPSIWAQKNRNGKRRGTTSQRSTEQEMFELSAV